MREAILMALLVATGLATAASVKIDSSDVMSIYADLPVIREGDDRIEMWVLLDYSKARIFNEKKSYQSIKALAAFDCKGALTSERYLSFHAENMGEGEVVAANRSAAPWSSIRPSTIEEKFWAFACGQK